MIKKVITACCEFSKQQLDMYCVQHGYECPDKVLSTYISGYDGKRRFSLHSPNATYSAKFCPSCGENLNDSCIIDDEQERIQDDNLPVFVREYNFGNVIY